MKLNEHQSECPTCGETYFLASMCSGNPRKAVSITRLMYEGPTLDIVSDAIRTAKMINRSFNPLGIAGHIAGKAASRALKMSVPCKCERASWGSVAVETASLGASVVGLGEIVEIASDLVSDTDTA